MVTFSQRQKISCMKLITAYTGQMYHNAAVALQSLHALVAKKVSGTAHNCQYTSKKHDNTTIATRKAHCSE